MPIELRAAKCKSPSFAALLAVVATVFTACSSDNDVINEQPMTQAGQTYTLTVQASKGDNTALTRAMAADSSDSTATRALSLSSDGKTLNAIWKEDEQVFVFKGDHCLGYLSPPNISSDSASDIASAEGITTGDELALKYHDLLSSTVSNQDGTLETLSANYDNAEASITAQVATDGEGNATVTSATAVTFENQQAIVCFKLQNAAGQDISATQFSVNNGDMSQNFLSINPASLSTIFAALRGVSATNLNIQAICTDGNDYMYNRANVTFAHGKYYEVMIKMKRLVYLKNLTNNYIAQDGEMLYGTLSDNFKVSIAEGASVTLNDVTINGTNSDSYNWAGITCLGDATITLCGTNTLKGFHENYPAIYVPTGHTLTIKGDGTLTASSNGNAAGIGAGYGMTCGNITIVGGNITATGGNESAGIGGAGGSTNGPNGNCGTIRIEGGTVNATGGSSAPGIGSGNSSTCGSITILNTVTSVTATKDSGAPHSIGRSALGHCGTVTIGGTSYGTDGVSESPFIYPVYSTAKLGDLFYSDGTYSSTLVSGKTPIGVIAYLGTDAFTENGTMVGGSAFTGHGLVLCLKNAASGVSWGTDNVNETYEFGESAKVRELVDLLRTTNVSGYTNTTTLAAKDEAASKYPAAYLAKNYTGMTAPTGTTGWFLPSAQQWVKIIEGLGEVEESSIQLEKWFDRGLTGVNRWEATLAKAGSGNYDSMTGGYLMHWSSSEVSKANAIVLNVLTTDTQFFPEDKGFLFYFNSKNDISASQDLLRVRPVLAF